VQHKESMEMNKIVILVVVVVVTAAAPQGNTDPQNSYQPYEYQYKVEDAEKNLFFDKAEASDQNGKVNKKKQIWPEAHFIICFLP